MDVLVHNFSKFIRIIYISCTCNLRLYYISSYYITELLFTTWLKLSFTSSTLFILGLPSQFLFISQVPQKISMRINLERPHLTPAVCAHVYTFYTREMCIMNTRGSLTHTYTHTPTHTDAPTLTHLNTLLPY